MFADSYIGDDGVSMTVAILPLSALPTRSEVIACKAHHVEGNCDSSGRSRVYPSGQRIGVVNPIG